MRQHIIIYILTFLTACSYQNNKEKSTSNIPGINNKVDNQLVDQRPVKTVISFLKWYRDNMGRLEKIELVKNSGNDSYDSTKFYSVNFEGTEKYLSELKKSGFISDTYVKDMKTYFKRCEEDFKSNPTNDGPPAGFDFDLVMQSQEYDEDLKNIDSVKFIAGTGNKDYAYVGLEFPSKIKLRYILTRVNDSWLIDTIEPYD